MGAAVGCGGIRLSARWGAGPRATGGCRALLWIDLYSIVVRQYDSISITVIQGATSGSI